MAAPGQRVVDGTGDGKHLTPLLRCQSSGNQGTTFLCGFYHQCTKTEPADDSVSAREVSRPYLGSRRELGYERPLRCNSMGKVVLAGWIDPIQPGAGYGYGETFRLQGTAVAQAVYANCKSAGYGDA